jgi:hypothetical protein
MTTEDELAALTAAFFDAVSFAPGERPAYDAIRGLFIAQGLLIKNVGSAEITTVDEFIAPRRALVDSGELTEFKEGELSATTAVFGNVAHRMSAYFKRGVQGGVRFHARGMISTQFVLMPAGWRMSAMAWDDERPGLTLPQTAQGGTMR